MATYISEYRELRLGMKSSYTKEVNGRVINKPGKAIQFRDGQYTTEDEEEIEFIEDSAEYGRLIKRVDTDQEEVVEAQDEMDKSLEDKKKEEKAEKKAKEEAKMTEEGKGETSEFPDKPLSKWNKPPLKKKAKQMGLDTEKKTKKELYRKVKEAQKKDEPQF